MNIPKILKTTLNNSTKDVIKNMPEYVVSENLKNILYGIPKELSEIKLVLKQNCEEYINNAFKFENYVMIPANEELSHEIERIALNLDIFNSMSTLRLRNKLELTDNANLFIFSIGDAKHNLCKYNPRTVTDSAKTDYYNEMKRIIETGKINADDILNEAFWFMDRDGGKIYNLAADITGNTPFSNQEIVKKNLFDKLFNARSTDVN